MGRSSAPPSSWSWPASTSRLTPPCRTGRGDRRRLPRPPGHHGQAPGAGQAEDRPGRHPLPVTSTGGPAGPPGRRAAGGLPGVTAGHRSPTGPDLVRTDLCDAAIALARGLARRMPDEPEVTGLLALLLLTDARRDALTTAGGELVLLEEQDRSLWDASTIAEGEALLVAAARHRRRASSSSHHRRRSPARPLAPVPHGPGRPAPPARPPGRARAAYRTALELEPPRAERAFIAGRLRELEEPRP